MCSLHVRAQLTKVVPECIAVKCKAVSITRNYHADTMPKIIFTVPNMPTTEPQHKAQHPSPELVLSHPKAFPLTTLVCR